MSAAASIRLSHGDCSVRTCAAHPDAPGSVTVEGVRACPHCGAAPFRVGGRGAHPSSDDRAHEAVAACMACKRNVGTLRVEASTVFGVREDAHVLAGPWKVF
jgi:hypothetical protein